MLGAPGSRGRDSTLRAGLRAEGWDQKSRFDSQCLTELNTLSLREIFSAPETHTGHEPARAVSRGGAENAENAEEKQERGV